mmetsp:Transcript_20863/g.37175  ORF Transcript_20863/g.37175 Transcript_20863/m.37175 type:complete len:290 (+) Transcript_20863:140-1009(+)|eukprot:CAMPEP_0197534560 /NCGR_PEP_ID=MMETSP1318-20131121/47551_1 /TAXON_ID=552666 /ORGANISM="Partenskyella glossopodia, Strain RCC365" /LENGTH=289 /DNA_ID=CAMNT_0043091879 /DNA_START=130 /DNA_END=999 /DNA_ORIENTATION=-
MIRRNIRLRREYLYRKNLEGKHRAEYEKKAKIKAALESGKVLPTELRNESNQLMDSIQFDDEQTQNFKSTIDDEYQNAGVQDPLILLTTSHNPSSRLSQFAKEMKLVFPNTQRINRGGTQIKQLMEAARANEVTDVIILQENRGKPDGIIISHMPHGPTAYFGLSNVVLRHDIQDGSLGPMSEAYPHLIMNNFSSNLGQRVKTILKYLFPVPKADSRRVMTFANNNDDISFRHHVYQKEGHKEVQLQEVGPRFEMKLYQIKLGTIEMRDADNEWVLRPYMNTAKKRKVL